MFWTGELIARTAPSRRRIVPVNWASPQLEKATAAYLGLAIGDALGATVEFMTPNEIRHKMGLHRRISGGGWLRLKPGQVTDDTTMTLALGKAIIADQGRINPLSIAHAFDQWMREKPVDIGNTVRRNLITFRKTGQPEAPASEHDAGNGAAMRLLPIALACYGQPPETTRLASRAQAHVTHHNATSDAACETLIFMVQDFLQGKDVMTVEQERVAPLVRQHPVFTYDRKRCDNPSGYVVETMQAVFQAFFSTETFEDCLVEVVNRGGDADTTGAIAGMLAGACYGMAAIPPFWLAAIDQDIRLACENQALALITLANEKRPSDILDMPVSPVEASSIAA